MYTLKSIVQRGALIGAAASLAIATIIPVASVFADALNPLTERSLLLSSSAPGYQDTDGSGNSEGNPNSWTGPEGNYYALPGSGPNGKKTGETFTFRVSTDSVTSSRPITKFTLQYCTTAAGLCQAPGDNHGDARDGVASSAYTAAPYDQGRETNDQAHPNSRSDLDASTLNGATAGTDFVVTMDGSDVSTDWTLVTSNVEDPTHGGDLTGKHNMITLEHTGAGISPEFNDQIVLKFNASSTRYITNPGSEEFFVKINTFDTADEIIDGGVTVANVMTDSIHITTKVLETMAFSVGTENPDTKAVQHGSCDAMQVINDNRLDLGDENAEFSLSTRQAYDAHSYWRLSSNSSGGATVYYSGDTLRNTVGDWIAEAGATQKYSQPGTEQFGITLVPAEGDTIDSAVYTAQDEIDNPAHVEGTPIRPFPANHPSEWTSGNPWIFPLNVATNYNGGPNGGTAPISNGVGESNGATEDNAQIAFLESSKHTPVVIAQNNDQVVSCATAKVRYVGNIAADTPAGVYTTKINYLAAPQY